MKSGCIVGIAMLIAVVAGFFIVGLIASMGWIEERFGEAGVSFAFGILVVMICVFFSFAMLGAIMFGLSGLWVRSISDNGVMMGTMAESIAAIMRYSRLPAGGGGQAQTPKGPVFPPVLEQGMRPGQQALPYQVGGQVPPYNANQISQRAGGQPQEDAWGRPIGGRQGHSEVVAR